MNNLDLGTENAYPFIVNNELGSILIHKNTNYTYAKTYLLSEDGLGFTTEDWIVEEENNSQLNSLLSNMRSKQQGYLPYRNNLVFFRQIQSLGYSIGFVYPREEIFENVQQLSWNILIAAIVTACVLLVLITIVSKSVQTPIRQMHQFVDCVCNYDLTQELHYRDKLETGELADGLRIMRSELNLLLNKNHQTANLLTTTSDNLIHHFEQITAGSENIASAQ
jgi:methyl-accepting chemotaxis protein